MATTTTITKILLRRGNEADRKSTIFAAGEPAFTLDTNRLFIGDGITAGGIPATTIDNDQFRYYPEGDNVTVAQTLGLYVPGVSAEMDAFFHNNWSDLDHNQNIDLGGTNLNLDRSATQYIRKSTGGDLNIDTTTGGKIWIGPIEIVDNDTVNIHAELTTLSGTSFSNTQNFQTSDKNININDGGLAGSGFAAGWSITEAGSVSAGYIATGDSASTPSIGRGTYYLKPPAAPGALIIEPVDNSVSYWAALPDDDDPNVRLRMACSLYVSGAPAEAWHINQDLSTTSTPTFAGINMPGGGSMGAGDGGTGVTNVPSGSLLLGNGTDAMTVSALDAGQLLIGTSTSEHPAAATLTEGNGITISNSSGGISIATNSGSYSNLDWIKYVGDDVGTQTYAAGGNNDNFRITGDGTGTSAIFTGDTIQVAHRNTSSLVGTGGTSLVYANAGSGSSGVTHSTTYADDEVLVGVTVDGMGHLTGVTSYHMSELFALKSQLGASPADVTGDGTDGVAVVGMTFGEVGDVDTVTTYDFDSRYALAGSGENATTLDSLDSSQFLRSDVVDTKTSGDLIFNDNISVALGNSTRSEIYKAGSSTVFGINAGSLSIKGNGTSFTETMATFTVNAGCSLYYNNTETLRVASGQVDVNGDVVAFSTAFSDAKLKKDVLTIDSALAKVLNLRGVEFTWVKGSREEERDIGVIAQEVEEVIPEVVRDTKSAFMGGTYKTVEYEKLVPLLIESVKELSAKVDHLEGKLAAVKTSPRHNRRNR